MTFIEAVESGKPFRRRIISQEHWYVCKPQVTEAPIIFDETLEEYRLDMSDILATDWEINNGWKEKQPYQFKEETTVPKTEFGRALKQYRVSRGMTQKQVALNLKVHRTLITHFETSLALPSYDSLVRMSEVLGIDVFKWILKDLMKKKNGQEESDGLLPFGSGSLREQTLAKHKGVI